MARMVGKLFGWVDCENGEAKLLTPLREEYNIRLWDLLLLAFCSNVTQASGFLPHIAWDATLNPTPPHFRSALRHRRQAAEAHAKVLKHVEAMQSYLLCLTTSYVDSAAQVLDSCWLAKTRGLPARLLNRLPKRMASRRQCLERPLTMGFLKSVEVRPVETKWQNAQALNPGKTLTFSAAWNEADQNSFPEITTPTDLLKLFFRIHARENPLRGKLKTYLCVQFLWHPDSGLLCHLVEPGKHQRNQRNAQKEMQRKGWSRIVFILANIAALYHALCLGPSITLTMYIAVGMMMLCYIAHHNLCKAALKALQCVTW